MATQTGKPSIAKASRKVRVIKAFGWAVGVVVLAGNVLVASNAANKSPKGGIPVISIANPGNGGQKIATPLPAVHDVQMLAPDEMTNLFQAAAEATEEAILNALFSAEAMIGRDGHVRHALPIDEVVRIMRQYGRLGAHVPPASDG